MRERSYTLVQQWLQQAPIEDGELQRLVAGNPYFSAAQLLLLERLDATTENYKTQKSLAALHVYNPIELEETKTFDFPFATDNLAVEMPAQDAIAEEPISLEEKEADTFEMAGEAPTVIEQQFIKAEPAAVEVPEDEPQIQKEKERFEEDFTDDNLFVEAITEKEIGYTEAEAETKATNESSELNNQNNDALDEAPQIKLPSFDLNAPANMPAGNFTFEPFHTVDYFASQGIKLSQTEAGNDRFGKQVKSFTEWLKTMKKLPTTAITQNTDGVGESKVANLAAHSLQNADVVTESMAEVWVKQGNIQKASEVYNKLSLQNPSKKAYFAAKIESLKKPS